MNYREIYEEIEHQNLAPYATFSDTSKGRALPIEKCDVRTEFGRDRDKIIHSMAFRKLKHKTQVFLTPNDDLYRTRLTHTLEVSQVARTIARGLRLNEDLVEAASLGHDLGHTPFGHAGEAALNSMCSSGFRHYEQSLRIVEVLESKNLTFEVKDAILNHTGEHVANTLEGKIIKFADRIAYINHDIDDAIRAGVIKDSDLPRDCIDILGNTHSKRINTMILSILKTSSGKPIVEMDEQTKTATLNLRKFLFDSVYIGSFAKKESDMARGLVVCLFEYYMKNIDALPKENLDMLERDGAERVVCDAIASMTDRGAIKKYSELFLPHSWSIGI